MMDAAQVRAKHETFDTAFRGYQKKDVAAYLGRLALAFEVMGDDASHLPELPSDFRPAAIRGHEFDIGWRGLDQTQVRAYLAELSTELETMLSAAAPPAALHLPTDFDGHAAVEQSTGVLLGSEILVRGQRLPVNFATPEGLTADLSARLASTDACLLAATIVVSELSEATMRSAVAQLDEADEL
jgi:DivIVA domain-containing protein